MRAPGCGGARPLRESARAVLEWRAARTGHGYRVEDKSPARPPPPAKPSLPTSKATTYTQPPFLLHVLSQCRLFVTTGLCTSKTLRVDFILTLISTFGYKIRHTKSSFIE